MEREREREKGKARRREEKGQETKKKVKNPLFGRVQQRQARQAYAAKKEIR